MITAILIAKNEQEGIIDCLKQLNWTDEQLVIDNNSNDKTAELASKQGAKVIQIKGNDFSLLRNTAATSASYEWLLYIDVDEKVTKALRDEIIYITRQVLVDTNPRAYVIKRTNYYLGRKWPTEDGMIRLIYKPSLVKWYGTLHETAQIHGEVGELKERLLHYTHQSLEQMVAKTNEWSAIEASLRFNNHHPKVVPWRLIRVMFTGFWNSYITQQGFKAGSVGFIESIYQGFSMFITYSKLWEMQQIKK